MKIAHPVDYSWIKLKPLWRVRSREKTTLKHERLQKAHDGFARVLSIQLVLGCTQRVQSERSTKGRAPT